jgi:hypothetical protein
VSSCHSGEDSVPGKIEKMVKKSARVLRKRGVSVQYGVDATRIVETLDFSCGDNPEAAQRLEAIRIREQEGGGGGEEREGKEGEQEEGEEAPSAVAQGAGTTLAPHSTTTASTVSNSTNSSKALFRTVFFGFPRASDLTGVNPENLALLAGFFSSSQQVLIPGGTVVLLMHISWLEVEGEGMVANDQFETWGVEGIAAKAGLVRLKTLPFTLTDFPTYRPRDVVGRGWTPNDAIFHVLGRATEWPAHSLR